MKKSLIGLVAVAAMSVSLTVACTQKKAEIVTIPEIHAIDMDGNWELEGKYVTVEHVALSGRAGNLVFGQTVPAGDSDPIYGIEAQLKSWPKFTQSSSGYGSDISITGTLKDVEGRAVLTNATLKVNSERVYNEDKSDYTGGLAVYYYYNITRSSFDQTMDRTATGVAHQTIFQVATVPTLPSEDVETTEDIVFWVVFPGENTNYEDPYNLSLIPAKIPAGTGAKSVKALRDYFADHGVSDYIDLTYISYYGIFDDEEYPALLLESFWGQDTKYPAAKDIPEVYTTFEALQTAQNDTFEEAIPDFGVTNAFSYGPVTVETLSAFKKHFTDSSWMTVANATKVKVLQANINYSFTSDQDLIDTFNEFVSKAQTAGFTESSTETGQYEYIGELKVVESEKTIVKKMVYCALNIGYLTFYYFAPKKPASSSSVIA